MNDQALPLTFEFRTVADMHTVPFEKLEAFTTDLMLWLQTMRMAEMCGMEVVSSREVFGWIDDGRHDAKLTIEVKQEQSPSPSTEGEQP